MTPDNILYAVNKIFYHFVTYFKKKMYFCNRKG